MEEINPNPNPNEQLSIQELTDKIFGIFIKNSSEEYKNNETGVYAEIHAFVEAELLKHGREERLRDTLQKIEADEYTQSKIKEQPGLLFELCSKFNDLVGNKEKLDFFIYNYKQRKQEVASCWKEKEKRFEENPLATDEEIAAGTYKEAIESQVRDAVFVLQKKGYVSFESGFYDLKEGSQYIGFDKNSTQDLLKIPVNALVEELKKAGVATEIISKSDRKLFILVPSKTIDLQEWKKIWDMVADVLPKMSEVRRENRISGYSQEFARTQEKIRRGEDVALGNGFVFVGGKFRKVSSEEFVEIMKRTEGK